MLYKRVRETSNEKRSICDVFALFLVAEEITDVV